MTFALLTIVLEDTGGTWGFVWSISEKWTRSVGAHVCVIGRREAEDARLEQTMGSWAGKGQMKPK